MKKLITTIIAIIISILYLVSSISSSDLQHARYDFRQRRIHLWRTRFMNDPAPLPAPLTLFGCWAGTSFGCGASELRISALRPMAMRHQDVITITSTPLMDIIAQVLSENQTFLGKIFFSRNRIASRVAYRILDADIDERNSLKQELTNRAYEIELGIHNGKNEIDEIILLAYRRVVNCESKRIFLTKGGIFVAGTALSPLMLQMRQTGQVIATAKPRISPVPLNQFSALSRGHWELGVTTGDERQYRLALTSHAWLKGEGLNRKKLFRNDPLILKFMLLCNDAGQRLRSIELEEGEIDEKADYVLVEKHTDGVYGLGMSRKALNEQIKWWDKIWNKAIVFSRDSEARQLLWTLTTKGNIEETKLWLKRMEVLARDCAMQGRGELVEAIKVMADELPYTAKQLPLHGIDTEKLQHFESLLDSLLNMDLLVTTQKPKQKLLSNPEPTKVLLQNILTAFQEAA